MEQVTKKRSGPLENLRGDHDRTPVLTGVRLEAACAMRLQGKTYQEIADVIETGDFLYRGETIPPVGRKVYKQQVHSTLLGQRGEEVMERLRRSMWSNIIDEADAHAGTQLRKLVGLRDAATAAAKDTPPKGPDKARLLKTAADIQQQVIELSRAAAGSVTVRTGLRDRGRAQTVEARRSLDVVNPRRQRDIEQGIRSLMAAGLVTPDSEPLLRHAAALIHIHDVKMANPQAAIEIEARTVNRDRQDDAQDVSSDE